MTDKLVTHADLLTLRGVRARTSVNDGESLCLLDRLIAAAEADQPPLPEGWVIYDDGIMGARVYWHQDGDLYHSRSCRDKWHRDITPIRHRLTPLRPTVTEADVEKAAQSLYVLQRGEWVSGKGIRSGGTPWGTSAESAEHDRFLTLARAAFEAAGIEVRDV